MGFYVKKLFDNPVFKFISSIKLALPMILLISALLAAGTIVESHYSTAVAKRFVYGTWWFSLALLLLGLNVFCSAISRYPWKKHQTGFVITHLGILIILAGSLITQQYGLDGQIALNEGEQGHIFQEDKPTLYYQIDQDEIQQIPAAFTFSQPSPDKPVIVHLPNDGALMINQFYVNAQKRIVGREVETNEKGFPAVYVILNSSFVHENQWLFLENKDYGHLDLGPASVFFEKEFDWKKRLANGSKDISENALAILLADDGSLKYQTRHKWDFTPIQALKVNEDTSTGWMDMQFKVQERLPNAFPEETYEQEPFGYQKDLEPALHYEVIYRSEKKEGWLGMQTQNTFSLLGENFSLAYGPKQIHLPFSLHLVKFKLGLDPGTDKPASYASDIYYMDEENQGTQVPANISMNQPLHHRGYTVYQASYQALPGGKYTSVFAVGVDPGMFVKYTGAIVMVFGIILMFWFKNPAWGKKDKNA
jgi:hypothetical protein